jgi:tRNA-binding EMAP/Myf-like protein
MDMRVGKILGVWVNTERDDLYNEKVDIGNGEIRNIASALHKYVPLEQMKDQLVVVLLNLKSRKIAGYDSHGMVLCAETPDKSVVELLIPPAGSVPGDIITFEGFERKPPAELPAKKKPTPWDNV